MKSFVLTAAIAIAYVMNAAAKPKVRVSPIVVDNSFDNTSMAKLKEAVKLLDSAFSSPAFAARVSKESFPTGSHGLSATELLEIIVTGLNDYQAKIKDYSIDLRVKVYDSYKGGHEFGNTDMDTRITQTHRCYILRNDVKCYASHLAHEYMHQIGFYDTRTWFLGTKTQSVPYKIGAIIDELIGNTAQCEAISETCRKE